MDINSTLYQTQPTGYASVGAVADTSSQGQALNPNEIIKLALAPGKNSNTNLFGENGGSIGDYVWNDLNHNGIQEALEPPLPGIGVRLTNAGVDNIFGTGDDTVTNTTTDTTGKYLFGSLLAGKYKVQILTANLPSGFSQTFDPDSTLDNSYIIQLLTGEDFLGADFGYAGAAPIPLDSDLQILKSLITNKNYQLNDTVDFDIITSNLGNLNNNSVIVTETLPPELEFISATYNNSNIIPVNLGSNQYEFTIPSLNVNQSAVISLRARVIADLDKTVQNKVDVASTIPDPNTANNTATVDVTLISLPLPPSSSSSSVVSSSSFSSDISSSLASSFATTSSDISSSAVSSDSSTSSVVNSSSSDSSIASSSSSATSSNTASSPVVNSSSPSSNVSSTTMVTSSSPNSSSSSSSSTLANPVVDVFNKLPRTGGSSGINILPFTAGILLISWLAIDIFRSKKEDEIN